jgi:predicted ATPase
MPANALDYITIKGFKSIASVEKLELRPINVLIGANGSGKSNFIGVFAFLHEIREGRLQHYVTASGGAEKLLHFGSKTTREMSFHLSFAGHANEYDEYELRLFPTEDDGLFPWDPAAPNRSLADLWQQGAALPPPVRDRLGGWRVYHVHDTSSSSPMRKTAKVDDNDFLRSNGSNLASFLYYLRERHEVSYSLIQRTIQRVAPFFDDFRLKPLNLRPDDIKLEWRHKSSDQYFDASSLSDGTLRFIVLATLFLQPVSHRPSVILVDEPELGLHPYAIGILASLIRQAAVDTQVIVSTQSSLLVDYLKPEDVLVVNRIEGGTTIAPLKPDQLATWLEDYSLGQLWEKNELGGRPVRD